MQRDDTETKEMNPQISQMDADLEDRQTYAVIGVPMDAQENNNIYATLSIIEKRGTPR